jgi:hypothetical protein
MNWKFVLKDRCQCDIKKIMKHFETLSTRLSKKSHLDNLSSSEKRKGSGHEAGFCGVIRLNLDI